MSAKIRVDNILRLNKAQMTLRELVCVFNEHGEQALGDVARSLADKVWATELGLREDYEHDFGGPPGGERSDAPSGDPADPMGTT